MGFYFNLFYTMENWNETTPKERRLSYDYFLINQNNLSVNQCDKIFCTVGFQYIFDNNTYEVQSIYFHKGFDIYFIFSKII